MTPAARREALLVAGLLAFFSALLFARFEYPRMILDTLRDEAAAASWAAALRAGASLGDLPGFGQSGLYHGSTTKYLMLPFFLVFGTSWTLVRLWPAVFGLLTMLAAYLFARETFGRRAALLSLALLAAHPSFAAGVRAGNFQVSSMIFFSTCILLLFRRWMATPLRRYAFAAGLLAGLGLGTRLWFAWFAFGALLSGAVVLSSRERRAAAGRAAPWTLFGLAVGGFPIAWSGISSGISLFAGLPGLYAPGGGSEGVFAHLGGVWSRFNLLLAGGTFREVYFNQLTVEQMSGLNWLLPAAFWAGAAGLVWRALRGPAVWRGGALALAGLFAAMFAAALVSPSRPGGHYFFVFYPIPQIVLGVFIAEVVRERSRAAALLLAAALLAGECRGLVHFYRRLEGGCTFLLSDAIRDVGDRLSRRPPGTPAFVSLPLLENLTLSRPGLGLRLAEDATDRLMSSGAFSSEAWAARGGAPGTLFAVQRKGYDDAVVAGVSDWARRRGGELRMESEFDRDSPFPLRVYVLDVPAKRTDF